MLRIDERSTPQQRLVGDGEGHGERRDQQAHPEGEGGAVDDTGGDAVALAGGEDASG